MSTDGLIPFSQIDLDDPQYSEANIEAADFLSKMDWEGGITGLLFYSTDAFPEELRAQAEFVYHAIEDLHREIDRWAAERGVYY